MEKMDIPDTCQIRGLQSIYRGLFQGKKDGFFVDVGAHDGITHSNTWGLAKSGWSGICIEPVHNLYNQCARNHRDHNVVTYCVAVGERDAVRRFYTDGKELYTGSEKLAEILGANIEYEHFKVVTLDSILLERKIKPYTIDVLSIDVEGMEVEVLDGFSLQYWMPRMVIVEAHEKHKNEDLGFNAPMINHIFRSAVYKKIYSDGINNIYTF